MTVWPEETRQVMRLNEPRRSTPAGAPYSVETLGVGWRSLSARRLNALAADHESREISRRVRAEQSSAIGPASFMRASNALEAGMTPRIIQLQSGFEWAMQPESSAQNEENKIEEYRLYHGRL